MVLIRLLAVDFATDGGLLCDVIERTEQLVSKGGGRGSRDTRRRDLPMALVSNELPTYGDDVTDAELEAYINRTVPGRGGNGGATNNRNTQPLFA